MLRSRTSLGLVLSVAVTACGLPEHVEPWDQQPVPPSASGMLQLTAMDQAVIDCALVDFLDGLSAKLPLQPDGSRQELEMNVQAVVGPQLHTTAVLLDRPRPGDWTSLPDAFLPSLQQAAEQLVERSKYRYAGLDFCDPRIHILAAPTFEESWSQISVAPPGYGFDGELAIVCFIVPFGEHLLHTRRVLAHFPSGWKVIVRPFNSSRWWQP